MLFHHQDRSWRPFKTYHLLSFLCDPEFLSGGVGGITHAMEFAHFLQAQEALKSITAYSLRNALAKGVT